MRPLLMLLVVPLLAQDDNEAEQAFRKMEKQIIQAKGLKLSFVITANVVGQPSDMNVKGNLILAEGNKVRFEATVKMPNEDGKIVVTSNGANVQFKKDDVVMPDGPSDPATLSEAVRNSLARASFLMGLEGADQKRAEKLTLTDFQLKKDSVAGRETQIVTYKITSDRLKDKPGQCSVWIDAKTSLPFKRTLTMTKGGKEKFVSETYSNVQIDPMVDPKVFELSK